MSFVDHLKRGDESHLLVGCISDQETTLGFLLAGIGQCVMSSPNYMITDKETSNEEIENFFTNLYQRSNICVIIISYDNMKILEHLLVKCTKQLPVIVPIPTKSTIHEYILDKAKKKRQMRRESEN